MRALFAGMALLGWAILAFIFIRGLIKEMTQ